MIHSISSYSEQMFSFFLQACGSLGQLLKTYYGITAIFWVFSQLVRGNILPKFRESLSVQKDSWTLRTGPIVCPETTVTNCLYSLSNDPEERNAQLCGGGSLISRDTTNWNTLDIIIHCHIVITQYRITIYRPLTLTEETKKYITQLHTVKSVNLMCGWPCIVIQCG